MEFLYPSFLWALTAVAIPVIIHLIYFRRFKKVYFSNIKFLKEIKEETTNTNKLKNLLILLARIFAIAFLVLAFAQPYIPQGEKVKSGTKGVSIYIDNSFSMEAMSDEVSLLDKAKKTALEIVEGYSEKTEFQIITNELKLEDQRWTDKKNAIEKIKIISYSPIVHTINNIISAQNQGFKINGANNKYAFWISDFQKNIFDLKTETIDSTIEYNLVILQAVRENNISIDSCYWDKPVSLLNYINKLHIKMSNNSNEDIEEIPLSLEYNKEILPLGKFKIGANSTVTDTIDIRIKNKAWNEAKISLKDHPMVFDDEYYFTFNVPEKIKVLNINQGKGANRFLQAAFSSDQYFEFAYSDINQVDYSRLEKNNLVILEDIETLSSGMSSSLLNSIKNGLNVLFFPSVNANIQSINGFLSSANANNLKEYINQPIEANKLNQKEFVLKDVYDKISGNFPPVKVKAYYQLSNFQSRNKYDVINFKNNSPFISRYQLGKGQLYLCSSPFNVEINELAKNPDIFIPMLFKMSVLQQGSDKMSYTIGIDRIIELSRLNIKKDNFLKIKNGNSEFIPKINRSNESIRIDEGGNIKRAGIYSIFYGDSIVQKIAFNFDRKESKLEYAKPENLEDKLNNNVKIFDNKNKNYNFTKMINAKERGVELWKWTIILALIFLAIEIFLLRFWKN
jgi:hypothetical protein